MFPPFSCSASTAKVLLLAGLNRFRFLAAGHASGANFSGLKNEHESRKLVYTTEPDTLIFARYYRLQKLTPQIHDHQIRITHPVFPRCTNPKER